MVVVVGCVEDRTSMPVLIVVAAADDGDTAAVVVDDDDDDWDSTTATAGIDHEDGSLDHDQEGCMKFDNAKADEADHAQ